MIWLLKQKALPSAARPNLAYKRLHINKAPEDLEKCRNIASVWYQATLSGCNFWISKCKTTISIRVKMLVNFFGRNSKKKITLESEKQSTIQHLYEFSAGVASSAHMFQIWAIRTAATRSTLHYIKQFRMYGLKFSLILTWRIASHLGVI